MVRRSASGSGQGIAPLNEVRIERGVPRGRPHLAIELDVRVEGVRVDEVLQVGEDFWLANMCGCPRRIRVRREGVQMDWGIRASSLSMKSASNKDEGVGTVTQGRCCPVKRWYQ